MFPLQEGVRTARKAAVGLPPHCLKIFTDFKWKIHNNFIQFICMRKMISGAYEPLKKLVKINK